MPKCIYVWRLIKKIYRKFPHEPLVPTAMISKAVSVDKIQENNFRRSIPIPDLLKLIKAFNIYSDLYHMF